MRKTGLPCPSVIYEGIYFRTGQQETKGEAHAENEQKTKTRMVAVPEPPGTALLQQPVQALRPQLQAELSCHRGGVPAIFFQAGSWEG